MSRYQRHKHHKSIAVRNSTNPKLVDRLVYMAAIVEPLFSIPQAYQIYHDHAAANVSILTWAGFEVMTAIWIWYGITHKERMILIYQGLFFIVDGSVLVGALLYGAKLL